MMGHALARFEDLVELTVLVRCDHLKRRKQLLCTVLKVLFLEHLVDWDVNRCGFNSTIAVRDVVIGKLLTTEEKLGTRNLQQFIGVC